MLASLFPAFRIRADAERLQPDTLDLSQRARMALNALTGTVDERGEIMVLSCIAPPSITINNISYSACGPKYMESLALMSLMTGINLKTSAARKQIDYMLASIGEDGLFYARIGPDRPWDNSSPEDYANIYGQGRMLRAMMAMYQLDKDPVWVGRMKKLVSTLQSIAVRKTDPDTGEVYAYYPTTPGYGDIFSYPKSGWRTTELLTAAQENMADMPDHSFGIPLYLGGMIEPLTRYAKMFNDRNALELGGQLVRLVMRKEYAGMPDGYAHGVIPGQNGQFRGHFHAHTVCLRGILEYGIATNDVRLKNLARAGYEYARTFGIPRLGWFPEYTGKFSHETCGLANMVALAIKMSVSGVGDYWEDVDCYARNHLTEGQFTGLQRMKAANKDPLSEEQAGTLKRIVGTFAGWGTPESLSPNIMNCCTANGSQALYYVWDSIVREKDGVVSVNLLLNRRSPWLDIESALPYRGEAILRNKQAKRLAIRIPGWADKAAVQIHMKNRRWPLIWVQNYLLIENIGPGTMIKIECPIKESVEHMDVDGYEVRDPQFLGRHSYAITFRGNTAIDISPRSPAGYSIYDRKNYRSGSVPQVEGSDYVAAKPIQW